MNIDNGERENQFLEIDLIHGPQPLDEMRRRIDMRAPLSNVRENLRKEAGAHRVGAFLVPINCLSHFIWKSPATTGSPVRTRASDQRIFSKTTSAEYSRAIFHQHYAKARCKNRRHRAKVSIAAGRSLRFVNRCRSNKPTTSNNAQQLSSFRLQSRLSVVVDSVINN